MRVLSGEESGSVCEQANTNPFGTEGCAECAAGLS